MRLVPRPMACVFLISLCGCEWAITPDALPAGQPSLSHEGRSAPLTMVDMGAQTFAPACTVDQGDERPMVEGRSYVIAYVYGKDRFRAYGLARTLVEMGLAMVVGHQVGHGIYFVRSARGFNWDDPTEQQEAIDLMNATAKAMDKIYDENPAVLDSTAMNDPPYILPAERP